MKLWNLFGTKWIVTVACLSVAASGNLHADILIGATGSYNALSASQDYGGPTKSLNTFEDFSNFSWTAS